MMKPRTMPMTPRPTHVTAIVRMTGDTEIERRYPSKAADRSKPLIAIKMRDKRRLMAGVKRPIVTSTAIRLVSVAYRAQYQRNCAAELAIMSVAAAANAIRLDMTSSD